MDVFKGLQPFFKRGGPIIDNKVFVLHYGFTVPVLLVCCMLVTGRQYFGDPIDCTSIKNEFSGLKLDTYCWLHSTFSEPDAWRKKMEEEVAYPGVAMHTSGQKKEYHAYYQWVPFVLFIQAALFYMPRYFWKSMECGKVKTLILRLDCPVLPTDIQTNNRELLVNYLVSCLNSYHNSLYFWGFVFAEVLNFVNVVGQIFLMDTFLGGEFSKYGLQVIQFTEWDSSLRYDPMLKVFPRVTKCTFFRFGMAGSVVNDEVICVLSVNNINEKIYIFLWFWFMILSFLSGMTLLYRCVTVFCPQSRFIVTCFRASLANRFNLKEVVSKCSLGDWFLLNLLCKNLDRHNFRDVIDDFALKLRD